MMTRFDPLFTLGISHDYYQSTPQDFDYLVADLADRCGRSLDSYEQNPFYGRVHTVGDLVQFLCAQPKAQ